MWGNGRKARGSGMRPVFSSLAQRIQVAWESTFGFHLESHNSILHQLEPKMPARGFFSDLGG